MTPANEGRADDQISYKEYVDSQLRDVRRAAELALQSASGEAVPLRQFFDAVLDEQRRGMVVAEQEREKAAKALRDELARAIEEGDRALRDHIIQQVLQIREALNAADALERARIEAVSQRLDQLNKAGHEQIESRISAAEQTAEQHVGQLRRERELVTAAQVEAIGKLEGATEKRFESVNEFRSQLNDVISQFIPREVADAQFHELRKQMDLLSARFNTREGSDEGARLTRTSLSSTATIWIGVLGLVVAVLAVAVVVILANAGQ